MLKLQILTLDEYKKKSTFRFVMNILSYNIRGCGSLIKRKRLTHLIRREDFDVCFI